MKRPLSYTCLILGVLLLVNCSAKRSDSDAMIARNIEAQKDAFNALLAENRKDTAIKEIRTGLQYRVLKEDGMNTKMPTRESKVTVYYEGKLIDGRVFDSTQEGMPISFAVGQVIVGWQEALVRMRKGSKWQVFIASDLAYGDRGAGIIPPGAGLIFTIDLLEINN